MDKDKVIWQSIYKIGKGLTEFDSSTTKHVIFVELRVCFFGGGSEAFGPKLEYLSLRYSSEYLSSPEKFEFILVPMMTYSNVETERLNFYTREITGDDLLNSIINEPEIVGDDSYEKINRIGWQRIK